MFLLGNTSQILTRLSRVPSQYLTGFHGDRASRLPVMLELTPGGVSSQHLSPSTQVFSSNAGMLCFHPILGISVCLAESWIIKEKHIFNPVWLCARATIVCPVLCGLGLAWMKQLELEGKELYSKERREEVLFRKQFAARKGT